jgi:hypothetical protein
MFQVKPRFLIEHADTADRITAVLLSCRSEAGSAADGLTQMSGMEDPVRRLRRICENISAEAAHTRKVREAISEICGNYTHTEERIDQNIEEAGFRRRGRTEIPSGQQLSWLRDRLDGII